MTHFAIALRVANKFRLLYFSCYCQSHFPLGFSVGMLFLSTHFVWPHLASEKADYIRCALNPQKKRKSNAQHVGIETVNWEARNGNNYSFECVFQALGKVELVAVIEFVPILWSAAKQPKAIR